MVVKMRGLSIYILIGLLVLGLLTSSASAANCLQTGWTAKYYHPVTAGNSTVGTLTNYPVMFQMFNTSGTNSGNAIYTSGNTSKTWTDINFSVSGSATPLDYWIEDTNATAAMVWVEIPSITTTGSTVCVYTGKAGQTTDYQSGTNTFSVFSGAFSVGQADHYLETTTAYARDSYALRINSYSDGITGTLREAIMASSNTLSYSGDYEAINMGTTSSGKWNLRDANKLISMGTNADSGTHTIEIWAFGSIAYVIMNTTGGYGGWNATTLTSAATPNTWYPATRTDGSSSTLYVNWGLVRQRITPEPTHGAWTWESNVQAPVASFTDGGKVGNIGLDPQTVSFTDTSTNTPTAWGYNMTELNGTRIQFSTSQSPQNVVFNYGNWSVTLLASNSAGFSISAATWINVTPNPPNVAWSGSPTKGNTTTVITFTDTSTSGPPITAYNWSFHDGNVSATQSPTHQFPCTATGSVDYCFYSINHSASSTLGGTSWLNQSNYITTYANATPTVTASPSATSGTTSTLITFTGASFGGIKVDSWSWAFGDGIGTSSLQSPSYTYPNAGQYTATLTAVNSTLGKATASTVKITITNPTPTAAFSNSPSFGNSSTVFVFNDTSTVTNTTNGSPSYSWTLGDTGTATIKNVSHSYAAPAGESQQFTVADTVTDSPGTPWAVPDTVTKTNLITVYKNLTPTATVAQNVTVGIVSLPVQFTATPAGAIKIDEWSWTFGDPGGTSTAQSPAHTYTAAGQYTVSLVARNFSLGSTTVTETAQILVRNPAPAAAFTGSPLIGNTTTQVQFTDGTSGTNVTGWAWDFGDTGTSSLQSPTHTYTGASADTQYTVALTATDSMGTPWTNASAPLTKTDYITIYKNLTPTVTFTEDVTSGTVPFNVQFTATPAGTIKVDEWAWDFGDTGTSALQSPLHQYTTAGQYTVVLIATNFTLGKTVVTATNVILAKNVVPTVQWNATPTTQTINIGVVFVGTSTITNTTGPGFDWILGDGTTSTQQNVTNPYTAAGVYTINYTVTDSPGTPWEVSASLNRTGWVTIQNPSPSVTFTNSPSFGNSSTPFVFNDTCTVTNTTNGSPSYLWDLGDTTTMTTKNTSHNYAAPAGDSQQFTVAETVTDSPGTPWAVQDTNTKTNLITIYKNLTPTVTFIEDVTSGTIPFDVQFTATPAGVIKVDEYSWDFGDTGTSLAQNPLHTYTVTGQYTVTLTAVNFTLGTTVKTQTDVILAKNPAPTVSWNVTPIDAVINSDVVFVDNSTIVNTTSPEFTWDFGDTGTSTLRNLSHQYTTAGTYQIHHSVTDSPGTPWEVTAWYNLISGFIVRNPKPAAAFTGAPLLGNTTTLIQFTDGTTGTNVTGWAWDFGDTDTSALQSPTHTYSGASVDTLYTVALTANDSAGTPWFNTSTPEVKSDYIMIYKNATPTVTFTESVTSGVAPLTVDFIANEAGAIKVDAWSWAFDDGGTSALQNPSHDYITAGQYTVSLTATNYTLGTTTVTHTNVILVQFPSPSMSWSKAPDYGNATTLFTFTDSSTGINVNGWFWDFHDGNTSTLPNPTNIFPCNTGEYCVYDINHSATEDDGTPWANISWLNKTAEVVVYQNLTPTITLSPDVTSGSVPFDVQFTATQAGEIKIDGWAWNFGDTGTSALQNPLHSYTVGGQQYTVQLTAVNYTLGEAIVTDIDLILAKNPVPIVVANATPALTNLTTPVIFVDSTLGNLTDFNWDLKDGNTTTDRNTSHLFPHTGTFDVLHNVTDSGGTPWQIISGDLILPVKVVNETVGGDFTGTPTAGTNPAWVHFVWTGTGGPEENHTWDFGEGNMSTAGTDVWHFYEVTGVFTISMTSCNDAGCTVVSKANYITVTTHGGGISPPHADLLGVPTSGNNPLDVVFTDTSDAFGATLWSWDFGDTTPHAFTQNAGHIYTAAGVYTVSHSVSNASGTDTMTKVDYITVGQFSVDFTANVTTAPSPPLAVQFAATPTSSSLIDEWFWDFGDGQYDNTQNPVNIYLTAGSFTVHLRIRNVSGMLEYWRNKTDYINIIDLNATLKMKGDIGDSWIKWEWKTNSTVNSTPTRPVDLYLDGSPTTMGYTSPYYYLEGLDSNEEHRLEARDNMTQIVLARSTLRTLPNESTVVLILVFCVVISLITVWVKDEGSVVVTGLIGIILASYGRSISYNYYGIDWIFLAVVFAMIFFVGRTVLGYVREKLKW